MAQHKGYFKDEGTELNLIYTKSSAEQFRGLHDGAYSLGHTLMDNIIA